MLRTPTFSPPDLTYQREGGKERSELQQALIRTCYHVMRSEDKQDLARIVQRYYLTRMYSAHSAYVEEYRGKGLALQRARQRVNEHLCHVFTKERGMALSIQTVKNHLKEGRHWYEILHTRETQNLGNGLLLLLPVQGYQDISRKTGDSIWQFLVPRIPSISPRLCQMALALEPLGKCLQVKGVGHVDVPLIGFEMSELSTSTIFRVLSLMIVFHHIPIWILGMLYAP